MGKENHAQIQPKHFGREKMATTSVQLAVKGNLINMGQPSAYLFFMVGFPTFRMFKFLDTFLIYLLVVRICNSFQTFITPVVSH